MLVKELIYMVLDMVKGFSDDFTYTEEHVLFLCKKYRVFLIKKEQEKNKGIHNVGSEVEQQQLCLELEKVGEPCEGYYLRTTKPVPKILDGYLPRIYPVDYYQGAHITFVSRDRMRYVGSNPYLKNIIYVSNGPDMHLYLTSSNPLFLYINQIKMSAVFEDFDEVGDMLCDTPPCDVLDMEFPIRAHLVAPLIELVVQELSGSIYRKADENNNAKDDLSGTKS